MVSPIQAMLKKAEANIYKSTKASSSAAFAIEMWRVSALMLFQDPDCLSVSLEEFVRSHGVYLPPQVASLDQYVVFSDAGINEGKNRRCQLGVAIFRQCSLAEGAAGISHGRVNEFWEHIPPCQGPPVLVQGSSLSTKCTGSQMFKLVAYSSVLLPYADPKNKYQNLNEYMGLLACLMLHVSILTPVLDQSVGKMHIPSSSVIWHGDNKCAISWADKHKCSSVHSQSAAHAVTWFQTHSRVTLSSSLHVPGTTLVERQVDALSRGHPHTLPPNLYVDMAPAMAASRVFELCDPTLEVNHNCIQHHESFQRVHKALQSFCAPLGL